MAWDVTVPDTFAEFHLNFTATKQGADSQTAGKVFLCQRQSVALQKGNAVSFLSTFPQD